MSKRDARKRDRRERVAIPDAFYFVMLALHVGERLDVADPAAGELALSMPGTEGGVPMDVGVLDELEHSLGYVRVGEAGAELTARGRRVLGVWMQRNARVRLAGRKDLAMRAVNQ